MCKTSVYPPFYSINIVIVNFSICSIQYIAFIETVDEYFTVQYFAPFKGRTVFNQFWTRVFRCSIAKIFCVWSCHGFENKALSTSHQPRSQALSSSKRVEETGKEPVFKRKQPGNDVDHSFENVINKFMSSACPVNSVQQNTQFFYLSESKK